MQLFPDDNSVCKKIKSFSFFPFLFSSFFCFWKLYPKYLRTPFNTVLCRMMEHVNISHCGFCDQNITIIMIML